MFSQLVGYSPGIFERTLDREIAVQVFEGLVSASCRSLDKKILAPHRLLRHRYTNLLLSEQPANPTILILVVAFRIPAPERTILNASLP